MHKISIPLFIISMNENRNRSLDFVKGYGVIIMVVHHSIEYFASNTYYLRYVRFVTGLFIFTTGFIISNMYYNRLHQKDTKQSTSFKLMKRGVKLLVLFLFTNTLIESLLHYFLNTPYIFWNNLFKIFILGDYDLASFALLLPISYLLLFSSILLFSFKHLKTIILTVSTILFIICSTFFLNQTTAFNLRFFTIGLVGSVLGFIDKNKFERIIKIWYVTVPLYLVFKLLVVFIKLYYFDKIRPAAYYTKHFFHVFVKTNIVMPAKNQ